jgi:hypothetical protein
MSHGRDQILVGDSEGNRYRSMANFQLPEGFHIIMRDRDGFSLYDDYGDLLSSLWNVKRLPIDLTHRT